MSSPKRLKRDVEEHNNKLPVLPVLSPREYSVRFPSFREPTEIGFYSLGPNRDYRPDDSQKKYIIMPNPISGLEMDLNEGYSDTIKKNFGKTEGINNLLKWILDNRHAVVSVFGQRDSQNLSFNADFVCYRGLLTAILCTVYENKDDWLICASKFRGSIYLCAFDTEQDKEREKNRTPRDLLMSSWGYKFEQYMTADSKHGKPDTKCPVNEKEEFDIVVKGRLNQYTILYGAEVDGVDGSVIGKTDSKTTKYYVELKTSRHITSERQDWNFCRYKLIKWWAQCFLIGIPKVICGFRDDSGIVRNVRTFSTSKLPKMAEDLWSPAVMMNFGAEFLHFVQKCVVKDDPHVVYKFYWKPGQNIECCELQSPAEYQVLPDWFVLGLR